MSELKEQSDRIDESLGLLERYTTHVREHVVDFAIKIKHFDKDCEACQKELGRIKKKSDKDPPAELKGDANSILSFSTILCFLGMHDECCEYYVLPSERIKLECLCTCHSKIKGKIGRKSKKTKAS